MLHTAQGLARETVHELVFHLLLQVEAELVNQVGRVDDVLGNLELTTGGLAQVLAGLLQQFRTLVPLLNNLSHHPEGGDARGHIVLVTALGHQREKTRHHRHRGLKRHHVGVISDARTGVLVRGVIDILAQVVAQNVEECRLRPREEGLPYAASLIEKTVVGYLFLILVPISFH